MGTNSVESWHKFLNYKATAPGGTRKIIRLRRILMLLVAQWNAQRYNATLSLPLFGLWLSSHHHMWIMWIGLRNPMYSVNFSMPNPLVCYVDYHRDADDLEVLKSEGFRLRAHRTDKWSLEEQRMFVAGLYELDRRGVVRETPNIGTFLSRQVMDECRTPSECLYALKNLNLSHDAYKLAEWCDQLQDSQ